MNSIVRTLRFFFTNSLDRPPPFAGPAAVLAYPSRSTRRFAISNGRLTRFDDAGGAFRYKDYR